jgi:hypothetical protein
VKRASKELAVAQFRLENQRALDSATQATRLATLKMEDVHNNIGLAI